MLVKCDNCNNHYEDTSQSPKCNGAGQPGHRFAQLSALEGHVANTRKARTAAASRGRA